MFLTLSTIDPLVFFLLLIFICFSTLLDVFVSVVLRAVGQEWQEVTKKKGPLLACKRLPHSAPAPALQACGIHGQEHNNVNWIPLVGGANYTSTSDPDIYPSARRSIYAERYPIYE